MARTKEFQEEEVLEKAIQLFWCKGYHATSVQDIVDCLGISRSSLYDTFGDKRQLFLQALQSYRRMVEENMIQQVEASTHPLVTIEALFTAIVASSLDDSTSKGCFMVNCAVELAPNDEEVAQIVKVNTQDIENAFFVCIQKGQMTGEITTRYEARALARFLVNTISGIRIAGKSDHSHQLYDDIVQITLAVLHTA